MVYVRRLTWNPSNVGHIARHGIAPEDVEVVCHGEHVALQTYGWRLLLIGPSRAGRVVTVVLESEGEDAYFVVTARPASRRERRYYRDWSRKDEVL